MLKLACFLKHTVRFRSFGLIIIYFSSVKEQLYTKNLRSTTQTIHFFKTTGAISFDLTRSFLLRQGWRHRFGFKTRHRKETAETQ